MSILIGTDKAKEIYLGTNKVKEIYLGTNKIYSGVTPVTNLWDASSRTKGNATTAGSRNISNEYYLYPMSYSSFTTRTIYISSVTIDSDNNVTFQSTTSSYGVGFPYTDLNGTYTLTGTSTATARLRIFYASDETKADNSNYVALDSSNNYTNTTTFTYDPTSTTYNSVLIFLEPRVTNTDITFKNISLTKVG